MKIVVDRRVFPKFRRSTLLLILSYVPIGSYLILLDSVFITQVTTRTADGSAVHGIWATAHLLPFILATVFLIAAWFALFFMGRNMRRDAVAIYLKKGSRKEMTVYEYRRGVMEVREALKIFNSQS